MLMNGGGGLKDKMADVNAANLQNLRLRQQNLMGHNENVSQNYFNPSNGITASTFQLNVALTPQGLIGASPQHPQQPQQPHSMAQANVAMKLPSSSAAAVVAAAAKLPYLNLAQQSVMGGRSEEHSKG